MKMLSKERTSVRSTASNQDDFRLSFFSKAKRGGADGSTNRSEGSLACHKGSGTFCGDGERHHGENVELHL